MHITLVWSYGEDAALPGAYNVVGVEEIMIGICCWCTGGWLGYGEVVEVEVFGIYYSVMKLRTVGEMSIWRCAIFIHVPKV